MAYVFFSSPCPTCKGGKERGKKPAVGANTDIFPYVLTYLQAEYDALDAFTPPALLRTPLEVSKY